MCDESHLVNGDCSPWWYSEQHQKLLGSRKANYYWPLCNVAGDSLSIMYVGIIVLRFNLPCPNMSRFTNQLAITADN